MAAKSTTIQPVTLPNGTVLYLTNQDASTINAGDGNFFVADFGKTATITVGNGNSVVMTSKDGATITAGNGNQVVAATGNANKITVGSNTSGYSIVEVGEDSTVRVGNGTQYVVFTGDTNNVVEGNGTDVIYALGSCAHNTTISEGNGTNWAFLKGQNNVVTDGTGTDVNWLGGDHSSETINAAGGTDYIYQFCNQDTLDLSKILAGLGAQATAVSLSKFIAITEVADAANPGLMDTMLAIKGSGGTAMVALMDYDSGGLTAMLTHKVIGLPAS